MLQGLSPRRQLPHTSEIIRHAVASINRAPHGFITRCVFRFSAKAVWPTERTEPMFRRMAGFCSPKTRRCSPVELRFRAVMAPLGLSRRPTVGARVLRWDSNPDLRLRGEWKSRTSRHANVEFPHMLSLFNSQRSTDQIATRSCETVHPEGLEPSALGLRVPCSTS